MAHEVETHYSTGSIESAIVDALVAMGKDPEHLDADDLAMVEEFHTLGRLASVQLADFVGVRAGDRVLDVGSGIGGPARFLAHTYGAIVTGIDLTPEFCEVATSLSRRVGLEANTTFRVANALDMPFDDASFDVVWTQHVAMNIADKGQLYREMRRVVKTGGHLAMFDITAGDVPEPHYPVPWAETADISFLEPADAVRAHLEAADFSVESWEDPTPLAVDFFAGLAASAAATDASGGPPPFGLQLVVPNLAVKAGNLRRNFEEGRVRLLQAVSVAV